jgi:uncharacterized protein GlcG (DUF336 family)
MTLNILEKEHLPCHPVALLRNFKPRRERLVIGIFFVLTLAILSISSLGCGGTPPTTVSAPPPAVVPALSATDVDTIIKAAATSVNAETMAIAVVDRGGVVLGIYNKAGVVPGATDIGNFDQPVDVNDLAVALARTGAYFSNDQAPLSSRTVRFISGIHFPPGVMNAPTADLYGIENTNRGCTLVPVANFLPGQAVNPSTALGGGPGPGILTGKSQLDDSDPNAVNPGGVPIFRNGIVVGGIGVAGVPHDVAEYAAFTASESNGFGLTLPLPPPGAVFIGGIALPFVNQTTIPAGSTPGTLDGGYIAGHNPVASAGQPAEGDLITPVDGPMGGLTAAEVIQILNNSEATANITRAAIRLPLNSSARMVIAVSDLDGTLIGLRRMTDATVFSIDVAASKARNMVYFNGPNRTAADLPGVPMGTAVTNRTISFGSQPLFPPGINGSNLGPFYNLFLQDVNNPCTQGNQVGAVNDKKSGVVFFPGSVGLYKNGVLVGGLGISGDGVDQDDFVTSGGSAGFEAPTAIRADQIFISGVRLPYFKFPRNPTF